MSEEVFTKPLVDQQDKSQVAKAPAQRYTPLRIAGMLWWTFSFGIMNNSVTAVALPYECKRLAGVKASSWLSMATGLVLVYQLMALVFCMISDRTTFKIGRRRPYILICSLIATGSMVLWTVGSRADNLYMIITGYLFMNSTQISGYIIIQALVPDLLPHTQHGMAGGFLGLISTAGIAVGYGFFSLGMEVWLAVSVMGALGLLSVIPTMICAKEKQFVPPRTVGGTACGNFCRSLVEVSKGFGFSPRQHVDWVMLLFIRMLFNCATASSTYTQYWASDVLKMDNAAQFASNIGLITLAIGAMMAFPAGTLSDRFGRKLPLAMCLLLVGLTQGMLAFLTNITAVYLCMVVFGIGIGMFASTTMAIACDTMPRLKDSGKFTAWAVLSATMGAYAGSFLFGQILNYYSLDQGSSDSGSSAKSDGQLYSDTGYVWMWLMSAGCCFSALVLDVLISPARGKRHQQRLDFGDGAPVAMAKSSSESTPLLSGGGKL